MAAGSQGGLGAMRALTPISAGHGAVTRRLSFNCNVNAIAP
jgi:hypothetical protein